VPRRLAGHELGVHALGVLVHAAVQAVFHVHQLFELGHGEAVFVDNPDICRCMVGSVESLCTAAKFQAIP
jgi:hypothetical protein